MIFEDCLFEKTAFGDARIYHCQFINCRFVRVDLRKATIGSHGGVYQNCEFFRCNFKRSSFYYPEFLSCSFDNCNFVGTDFNASYFDSCKFIGKLSDVRFFGDYYNDTKSDMTKGAKPNPMSNVDFSQALFGKYVNFINCDLATAIPPAGYTFEELLKISEFSRNNNDICTGEAAMPQFYGKTGK